MRGALSRRSPCGKGEEMVVDCCPGPRASDVVNKKTARFTIDTLVEMPGRVGKPVRLATG